MVEIAISLQQLAPENAKNHLLMKIMLVMQSQMTDMEYTNWHMIQDMPEKTRKKLLSLSLAD